VGGLGARVRGRPSLAEDAIQPIAYLVLHVGESFLESRSCFSQQFRATTRTAKR
jgi:hypothetical protein